MGGNTTAEGSVGAAMKTKKMGDPVAQIPDMPDIDRQEAELRGHLLEVAETLTSNAEDNGAACGREYLEAAEVAVRTSRLLAPAGPPTSASPEMPTVFEYEPVDVRSNRFRVRVLPSENWRELTPEAVEHWRKFQEAITGHADD